MSHRQRTPPCDIRPGRAGRRLLEVLALLALAGTAHAQTDDAPQATAGQSIEAVLAAKARRTPAQRKVGSRLLDAADAARRAAAIAPSTTGDVVHGREPEDRAADEGVTVDIRADVTTEVLARIESLGGTVINSVVKYRAIRARLPLAAVEPLAALDAVQFIRAADQAATPSLTRGFPSDLRAEALVVVGSQAVNTSEGDVAHGANTARQTHGVDGAGIGIGVISSGVRTLSTRQASGDLPDRVTVLPGQAGSGDEGTAMLEIVHDLAPGAELYFATGKGGQAQFAANVESLCEAGADIVIDDIFYFTEATLQDGVVAQGVNAAVAGGCAYITAAGNSGNLNDGTSGVWEGDYAAGSPMTVDGEAVGVRHDFGASAVENQITKDSLSSFVLQWADPLGASANDYDLFLVDADDNVLASSTDTQDGTQDPIESISSQARDHADAFLVVVKVDAADADRYLRLSAIGGQLEEATAGNVFGHFAAASAITVGAVDARTAAGAGGIFNGTESVRTYSSDGPRRIFFQPDGTAITAGNFSSTGGREVAKPDGVTADGVSTSTPGFSPFSGTSAAAPHGAAIAALMLEAAGGPNNVTQSALRTAMTGSALDIEATGVDRDSGAGIVMAPAAVAAVAVAVADRNKAPTAVGELADRELAAGGPAVTIDLASAFTDPDGDVLTYGVRLIGSDRVTTALTGSQLTLTPVAPGTATMRVRATDPGGLKATRTFTVAVTAGDQDYDADNDGLIEVASLAQLDALRYDLDGDGGVDMAASWPAYFSAFPDGKAGMGCPDGGGCVGYELTADLDFDTDGSGAADAGDTYWNDGAGWQPIGFHTGSAYYNDSDASFTAVFEGNRHTLANLYVDRPALRAVGLFGHADGTLRDLRLVGVNVTGDDTVGGLAGVAGHVERCQAAGQVSGRIRVGGLIGYAGEVSQGPTGVLNSAASVTVTGQSSVGGLVGSVSSYITSSYATGSVSASTNVAGGLVGRGGGEITSSYATGPVSAPFWSGGLIGRGSFNVTASYATGAVSGASEVGGLIGYVFGSTWRVRQGYWDLETSGVRVGIGSGGGFARGLTTAALQTPTGYEGIYRAWDADLDADGLPNHPWTFGTSTQYPALSADTDGDGRATWQEFGYQLRAGPALTATTTAGAARVVLSWTAVDASHWNPAPGVTYTLTRDDGATLETLAEGVGNSPYTDTDVTAGAAYTYQVAAVVAGGEATRSGAVAVIAGVANQSPVAVGALALRTLRVGGPTLVVDVSGAFREPDDDALTYTASSSSTSIATTSVSGALVTIAPAAAGRATITVTATDAGGSNTSATQSFPVAVWTATAVDYDSDDDGLIDIRTLAQLNAVRHDLNGDGAPAAGGIVTYAAAFPDAVEGMGCDGGAGCGGYELLADLDFDTNRNGAADAGDAYWNAGAGWVPIRGFSVSPRQRSVAFHEAFATTFEGNGHAIANLFIERNEPMVGLFGVTWHESAVIRNVGLIGVDVTGWGWIGGLVGFSQAAVTGSYVTGSVAGQDDPDQLPDQVGGLVGKSSGPIAGSYATAQVSGEFVVGGLVGSSFRAITASYATGGVSGTERTGGLVGSSRGPVIVSYATGLVSGGSVDVGGLVGEYRSGEIRASYWDTQTSGQTTGSHGQGKTTAQLQTPTGYSGIYRTWNVDLDGDGVTDSPWHFGSATQYPILSVDVNGDGKATWEEFGDQAPRPPGATVAPQALSLREGSTGTYTVALHSRPSAPVTLAVTVPANTDVSVDRQALTFTTNNWRLAQTIEVTAVADLDAVADAPVAISHTASGGGYQDVSVDAVTVTIGETDRRAVVISEPSLLVPEAGTRSYTVVLTSQPTAAVEVRLTTDLAHTDVSVDRTVLTFTQSNWSRAQGIEVTAADDSDGVADAPVTIRHAASGGDYGLVPVPSVKVTIVENDTPTLSVEDAWATEGVGEMVFEVALSSASSAEVTVKYASLGGVPGDDRASVGSDYTAVYGTLTFPAGTTGVREIHIVVVDDLVDEEEEETFTLRLFDARGAPLAGGGPRLTAVGTIRDDDDPEVVVSFGKTSYEVTEGGSVQVSVNLSADPERRVVIPLVKTPRGGVEELDYSGLPSSVVFASGETEREFPFTATDDSEDDDGEAVVLSFGTLPARVSGGGGTTLAILDNDGDRGGGGGGGGGGSGSPRPMVSVEGSEASESAGAVVFAVMLSAASSSAVTVDYATADGAGSAGARAGSDFTATSGTLTFPARTTAAQLIRVAITDDGNDEAEAETFTLTLRNPANASLAGGGAELQVTGTIRDDDDPEVSVSFGSSGYEVSEGGTVRVSVQLSGDPERELTIPLVHTHLGGAMDADYSGVPASVVFSSGTTTREFEFSATDDSDEDYGESVVVGFGDLPSGVSGGAGTTVSIQDDDTPPMATIDVGGAACDAELCRAVTGQSVRFTDRSNGPIQSRRWDFGDGAELGARTLDRSWSEPGFYEVTLWVSDGMRESTASRTFLVESSDPAGTCEADPETRCLQDSRYSVVVDWWNGEGHSGRGIVVHAGTNDSGLFRFFDRDNWEVLIKVLDGCALNGHVWVFGASTTDLGYLIRVTDTVTGTAKEYRNEPGLPAPAITDATAFAEGCEP